MKRRYVQNRDGTLVEVTTRAPRALAPDSGALWGDRHYDIGDKRFSTRTQHREYLKRHGLAIADDFKGDWEREAKARQAHFVNAPDPSRASDIVRAVEMVRAGHKPARTFLEEGEK